MILIPGGHNQRTGQCIQHILDAEGSSVQNLRRPPPCVVKQQAQCAVADEVARLADDVMNRFPVFVRLRPEKTFPEMAERTTGVAARKGLGRFGNDHAYAHHRRQPRKQQPQSPSPVPVRMSLSHHFCQRILIRNPRCAAQAGPEWLHATNGSISAERVRPYGKYLLDMVVGGFAGDDDVVDVAFAQAGI